MHFFLINCCLISNAFIIAYTNVVFHCFPLSLSVVSELDMSVARLSQEASSSEDSVLITSLL